VKTMNNGKFLVEIGVNPEPKGKKGWGRIYRAFESQGNIMTDQEESPGGILICVEKLYSSKLPTVRVCEGGPLVLRGVYQKTWGSTRGSGKNGADKGGEADQYRLKGVKHITLDIALVGCGGKGGKKKHPSPLLHTL